jgi:hypothetical protein
MAREGDISTPLTNAIKAHVRSPHKNQLHLTAGTERYESEWNSVTRQIQRARFYFFTRKLPASIQIDQTSQRRQNFFIEYRTKFMKFLRVKK